MSLQVADSVRSLPTIAVNGAYEFAPWAVALCANDAAWWRANPDALKFTGKRYCTSRFAGVERVMPDTQIHTSSCSGVLGLEVAKRLGATSVILLGADFSGSHFFGEYAGHLRNTSEERRKQHAVQFKRWRDANKSIRVLNCTVGSHLKAFPMATLESILEARDMLDQERAALSA